MSAPVPYARRGACPALQSPMQTGDGFLARIAPPAALTPADMRALCALARRLGNGIVEVTQRGNLQARGLSEAGARTFAREAISAGLGQEDGLTVLVDPLAGEDIRTIARAIRAQAKPLVGKLAPKLSVIVDGADRGPLHMDALTTDVRLRADGRRFILGVGRHWLGTVSREAAAGAVLEQLQAIAALGPTARGRDLKMPGLTPPPRRPRAEPVGAIAPDVAGVGLPFGATTVAALETLADAFPNARAMVAAAPYVLVLAGVDPAAVLDTAARLGFITDPADPRRFVVACAGAPLCASAFWPTREKAAEVATACAGLTGHDRVIHLSGCGKGCAHPTAAPLTVTGDARGLAVSFNAKADAAPS